MSRLSCTLALAAWLAAVPATARAAAPVPPAVQDPHAAHAEHAQTVAVRDFEWDAEVLDRFAVLPVQEDGRVKPFDTLASFLMLRLNGKRSLSVPDEPERFGAAAGGRLDPVEWALDCLFFPEQARHYPVFQVRNSEVLDTLGLEHAGRRKSDRYSYDELAEGQARLMSLTQSWSAIETKQRTPVQGQVVDLGFNFMHFGLFLNSLDFARVWLRVDPDAELQAVFGEREYVAVSDVLAAGPELVTLARQRHAAGEGRETADAVDALRRQVALLADSARYLSWFPPPAGGGEAWWTLTDLATATVLMPEGGDHGELLQAVAGLERMALRRDDPAELRAGAEQVSTALRGLAEARGEADGLDLEVALYRADPFWRALMIYLVAFVLAAVSWLRPGNRWTWKLVGLGTAGATLLLVGGIVVRCILRGRPPVTTLYETVLFVTAVAVITAMVIEWIGRRRVAISLAALLGAAGMFLAGSYERIDGQDTMPTLVAVLDTNFWLATHVTTVTMGYAAGLLAGVLAHVYLIGRLLRFKRPGDAFYRNIARMVYGVICFGLLFSAVGTILGGVWANESWGRFWGWDPKENGALMIVLWNILILHARMGGFIRDFGLCLLAVAGNIVVAFSWWGVNLLGVGLHSYGFTAGIQHALDVFYGTQSAVILLGAVAWMLDALAASREAQPARPRTPLVPAGGEPTTAP